MSLKRIFGNRLAVARDAAATRPRIGDASDNIVGVWRKDIFNSR
jgi:hypothetical protein